ncbi:glycosyltransferase family 2 protein [Vibrio pelagius]|uniref:glycosyltransferase family 2 protein n=1 Tax=Vibrio pelagius TaxID=28169 RepID=UPI0021C29616|nr:glycosyltransferase family A protein [Vibrio pelagius]
MAKVSVIVPVYNSEKYIEKTLSSLLSQTLEELEIIIIDDGSKDNSLFLIKSILERTPTKKFVRLINRENKGVSFTRNEGIRLAKGEYVIQLDSDDWCEKNWIEKLYLNAITNDSDIVICNYKKVFRSKELLVIEPRYNSSIEYINAMLVGDISGFSWNKLVRKEVIIRNNIIFPVNINYCEDLIFFIDVFNCSSSISYINDALVYYNNDNPSSITKKMDKKKVNQIIKSIDFIEGRLTSLFSSDEVLYYIDIFKLNQKCWIMQSMLPNVPKSIWLMYPESNKYITKSRQPYYIKYPMAASGIIGFGLSIKILKLLMISNPFLLSIKNKLSRFL